MRIVGGRWRGTPIEAPDGRGTRPTTDRTRESIASMVLSAFDLDLSDVAVLDAFAGSGALGLEMLSRGARRCTFVERDRRAASAIKNNIRALKVPTSAAILQVGDAFQLAERAAVPGGPFSLVLLDPPYATSAALVSRLVARLAENGQLTADAVILYERASDADGLLVEGTRALRTKAHKTTATDLLRFEAVAAPTPQEETR